MLSFPHVRRYLSASFKWWAHPAILAKPCLPFKASLNLRNPTGKNSIILPKDKVNVKKYYRDDFINPAAKASASVLKHCSALVLS